VLVVASLTVESVATSVLDVGIVVPLILVAVATPSAGVVSIGEVKVLFVKVCAVVRSAVTVVSIATEGIGPVPLVTVIPVPEVTAEISPVSPPFIQFAPS
jgi:hypothetical protein